MKPTGSSRVARQIPLKEVGHAMHERTTRSTLRLLVGDDRKATSVEPDEVLVADPRAALTPSQMVPVSDSRIPLMQITYDSFQRVATRF